MPYFQMGEWDLHKVTQEENIYSWRQIYKSQFLAIVNHL